MAFKTGDVVVLGDDGKLRKQDFYQLGQMTREGWHTAKGAGNAYNLKLDLSKKNVNYSITLGDSAHIHLDYPSNFTLGDGKAGIIAIHHTGSAEMTYDSCWQFAGGGMMVNYKTSGRDYVMLSDAETKITDAIAFVVVDSGEIYSSLVRSLGNPEYTW